MKKWMWYAIGIILIVGLAGGFLINYKINASTYKTSLQNGRTEIKNKQYNEAQADFQKAAKIKPNSMEANNLLSQTSKFVAAENKFKDYDFSEAIESFNDVVNYNQGSSVLKNRAKVELKILKQVSGNVTRLEKIYNQALKQNKAKQFDASNITLEGIFDDDLATNTFYAGIVKEAKKLKAANDDHVVLIKYKAKKRNTKTSNKKFKAKKEKNKTPKATKATKETSTAINAVTSTVAPTVATESDSDASDQAVSNSQTVTPTPSSTVSSSNKNSSSANNYQPFSSSGNKRYDSNPTSTNSTSIPASTESKTVDNSSQINDSSTSTITNQGTSTTSSTSSN